jgi:hypothetical protein
VSWASLPQRTPRHLAYGMGARPCVTRARNMQLPCSYTPFYLHHDQRSRRRTAAQGARNRPAVMRPFHLHRNQRSRRRTATQGACARPAVARPLSFAATGGSTSGMGAQAHMSYTRRAGSWVQESCTAAHANTAPLETKKINFQRTNAATRGTPRMAQQRH